MKNPFECGDRKVIPAVLVYAFYGDQVLMIHRDGSGHRGNSDDHLGKWNGLGGKSDLDESPRQTAAREFSEEASVEVPEDRFRPVGYLTFPNFKPHKNEDWNVGVFVVEFEKSEFGSLAVGQNSEGKLQWIQKSEVLDLPLWEGDQVFLPFVLQKKSFLGTFWYEDGGLGSHWIQPL